MGNGTVGVWFENSHDCSFGNITCIGIDNAVKITNSSNLTINEIKHTKPRQYTTLYLSINKILYST